MSEENKQPEQPNAPAVPVQPAIPEAIGRKHPGQPTLYSEAMLSRSRDYLVKYKEPGMDEVVPSVEGLADYLGVSRQTIYNWADDEDKLPFFDILQQLLVKQGKLLVNSGLKGDFSSLITKMMLTKHGYVEKTETDITTRGEKVMGINYIVPGSKPDEQENGEKKNENNPASDSKAAPSIPGAK